VSSYPLFSENGVIENSNLFDQFKFSKDEFKKWSIDNSYHEYISLTFHYYEKIDLSGIWGFDYGEWDIVFIVLSNYMDMSKDPSNVKTLISIAITNTEAKNKKGLTPNDYSEVDLLEEVYNQLSFLPKPDKMLLSPNVKKIDGKWINTDTAFVITNSNKYLDYKTKSKNLYTVGIHNGNSKLKITTLESAVQNAIFFVKNELLDINCKIKDVSLILIKNILIYVIIIIIVIIVLLKIMKMI